MKTRRPKIFVDFDGTITKEDVGTAFFRRFGNKTESLRYVDKWKTGGIIGKRFDVDGSRVVRVTKEDALNFAEDFEIDHGFKSFVSVCKR